MNIPVIPAEQVDTLVAELNSTGLALLPGFVPKPDLERMQSFVRNAVEKAGHQYVGMGGPTEVAGSGLDELYHSAAFEKLIKDIYERGTGKPAPDQALYHVLRCLAGPTGQKHAFMFHYDSYVVTALIPILIPDAGQSGDLLIFPNTRSIRPAYVFNAVDKVLLDNPLTQKFLRRGVEGQRLKPIRVKMQPGNIYFFWGYRSVHTNEPCDPDKVRATALFHYANPHHN